MKPEVIPLVVVALGTIKIDYFIENAPYGFLFTSRKTLEMNEFCNE